MCLRPAPKRGMRPPLYFASVVRRVHARAKGGIDPGLNLPNCVLKSRDAERKDARSGSGDVGSRGTDAGATLVCCPHPSYNPGGGWECTLECTFPLGQFLNTGHASRAVYQVGRQVTETRRDRTPAVERHRTSPSPAKAHALPGNEGKSIAPCRERENSLW